jgi:hypothetical protein
MRALALVIAMLLGLAAVGCGGDDSLAPQVPGEPATAPIPEAAETPGSEDSGTDDQNGGGDGEETPTPTATAEPDGTTGSTEAPPETAAAPEDTGGGTTAPETETDGPTNDTAPPAGSDAEQFEDFCAQNPGAC